MTNNNFENLNDSLKSLNHIQTQLEKATASSKHLSEFANKIDSITKPLLTSQGLANEIALSQTLSSYAHKLPNVSLSTPNFTSSLLESIEPALTSLSKFVSESNFYAESVLKSASTFSELLKDYPIFSDTLKISSSFAEMLSDNFKINTSSLLSAYHNTIKNMPCTLEYFSDVLTSITYSTDISTDNQSDEILDDYVTVDETSIKEFEFPDTIAISIGHNRVRMKTEIFITIIGSIIVPLFIWIAGILVDFKESINKAETETKRLEIESERNELLREHNQLFSNYLDILNSVDASNSSKHDIIDSWKEPLQILNSNFQDTNSTISVQEEVPDSNQPLTDNTI